MFNFLRKSQAQECPTWLPHAIKAADKHQIDKALFVALILNESSGDPFATRWERRFYVRYIADRPVDQLTQNAVRNLDTYQEQTVKHCLAYSWGLCQIMGVVAYEHGFRGKNCWELLDVETNVNLGARIFGHKLDKSSAAEPRQSIANIQRKALLAYNGGGDAEYPDRVLKRLDAAREMIKTCAR